MLLVQKEQGQQKWNVQVLLELKLFKKYMQDNLHGDLIVLIIYMACLLEISIHNI